MMPPLLPPRRSRLRAEKILGDAIVRSSTTNPASHSRQMIPCAVHPPRGCSAGVMPFLLPPSRSRLRAENILGDADRQMIPCAVHPPRGCDEGKSSKLLRGSDATPPPAESEQATCRKYPG
ncbi:hypothetical protein DFS34DRAFT_682760 [Phlyctochytrium arcticum]|nr:hypothetical protein DFS34DRAFT_682760 [Phlyctochytrium arcticum]